MPAPQIPMKCTILSEFTGGSIRFQCLDRDQNGTYIKKSRQVYKCRRSLRLSLSGDSFLDAKGSPRGRMVTPLSAGLTFVLPVVETTADFFDGIVRIDGDAERMPYGL